MNHHADKLVYAGCAGDAAPSEVVIEFHACPACGNSSSRPA